MTLANDLLEREPEIAALHEAIANAHSGAGRLVVVQAAAGLGKSRLLDAAGELALERRMLSLAARAAEPERGEPFGIARELLAECAGPKRLTGVASLAAGLFSGDLDGARDGPGVVQGLHALLAAAASAPDTAGAAPGALLRVDDAHWCDRPSLRFLAYVAARLHNLPVAIVMAVRPAEPGAPQDLLDAVRAAPTTRVLRPGPLSAAGIACVVRSMLGDGADEELCCACARATGGNPFYLRALLSALRERGGAPPSPADVESALPASVLHTTTSSLRVLGADAAGLAQAVAILGDGCSLRDAAMLAGLAAEAAEAAGDALATAGLLGAGEPLRLRHPLLAAAVRTDLGAFARARAHRRAADVLTAAGAPVQDVARQLALARPAGDPGVVAPLRAAAAIADGRGDQQEAARLLHRAVREPPAASDRAAVLVELARALALTGSTEALPRMREGLALIDDPGDRAQTLERLARLLHQAGRFRESAEAAGQARDQVAPDHALQPRLLAAFLDAAVLEPSLMTEAEAELGPLVEAARAGAAPTDPRLLAQLAVAMARHGDPPELVAALAASAFADDPLVDDETQGAPLGFAAAALFWVDELETAETALDAAVVRAGSRGAMTALSVATHWRAITHLHRGRLGEAIADARRSLEIHREGWTGSPWSNPVLALALEASGDHEGARAAIAAGEAASDGRAEDAMLLEARAWVELSAGDGEAALASARRAGEVSEGRYGARNARLFEWRRLAALGARLAGRERLAAELVDEHVTMVVALGAPRQLGATLSTAGLIAGGPVGLGLLEDAVAVLDESPSRLERARALLELGSALRKAGRRADAREPLRRALELGDAFGAQPLVRRARTELRAVGERPRRAARSGASALTPSERRVAELAAQGMSTPRIADELVVSRKTVESHLGRAYRKLGIAGRTALPEALGEGRTGSVGT